MNMQHVENKSYTCIFKRYVFDLSLPASQPLLCHKKAEKSYTTGESSSSLKKKLFSLVLLFSQIPKKEAIFLKKKKTEKK